MPSGFLVVGASSPFLRLISRTLHCSSSQLTSCEAGCPALDGATCQTCADSATCLSLVCDTDPVRYDTDGLVPNGCEADRQCVVPVSAGTAVIAPGGTGKGCSTSSGGWTEVKDMDPSNCARQCTGSEYFVHATGGDGNCAFMYLYYLAGGLLLVWCPCAGGRGGGLPLFRLFVGGGWFAHCTSCRSSGTSPSPPPLSHVRITLLHRHCAGRCCTADDPLGELQDSSAGEHVYTRATENPGYDFTSATTAMTGAACDATRGFTGTVAYQLCASDGGAYGVSGCQQSYVPVLVADNALCLEPRTQWLSHGVETPVATCSQLCNAYEYFVSAAGTRSDGVSGDFNCRCCAPALPPVYHTGEINKTTSTLRERDALYSSNGVAKLIVQRDGNILIQDSFGTVRWQTDTGGTGHASRLVMQADGNLVLYSSDTNSVLWATDTNQGARLVMQNDCNLVLYNDDGSVGWASNTGDGGVGECSSATPIPIPPPPSLAPPSPGLGGPSRESGGLGEQIWRRCPYSCTSCGYAATVVAQDKQFCGGPASSDWKNLLDSDGNQYSDPNVCADACAGVSAYFVLAADDNCTCLRCSAVVVVVVVVVVDVGSWLTSRAYGVVLPTLSRSPSCPLSLFVCCGVQAGAAPQNRIRCRKPMLTRQDGGCTLGKVPRPATRAPQATYCKTACVAALQTRST